MSERGWQVDGEAYRFGTGGLDLRHVADAVPLTRFQRLKNVVRTVAGGVTGRLGQLRAAATATPAAEVHSIARLEDPPNQTFVRVAGIDTGLWLGQTALQRVATGFSGDPLSIVLYRPPQSSEAWAYVGDAVKMVKVRRDGLVLPVGIAAPTAVVEVTEGTTRETVIDGFGEAVWEDHTYVDDADGGGSTGVWTVGSAEGADGDCLGVTLTPHGASLPAMTFANRELTTALNLTRVGGAGDDADATDDDLMRLRVWVDNPSALGEIRLYLITGAFSDTEGLPGVIGSDNDEGYVTAIRADIGNQPGQPWAGFPDQVPVATATLRRGQGVWTLFGEVDVPLRRSDFKPFGEAPDWSHVTGLVVAVSTANQTDPVVVTLDSWSLRGGSGADSVDAVATPYDYRSANYDPRTGDLSNGSPVMSAAIDGRRQRMRVDPQATGDPVMRQWIYRRGGTLPDDWWFVGATTGDGAVFVDEKTDAQAEGSGLTLPDDHDQPVTTTSRTGESVTNVPLRALWGPVAGLYLMGCGDPYRKGHVYWSKAGEPGHWSPANNLEVSAPSEELLAGLMFNAQSFVFSRERLFACFLQGGEAATTFTAQPTPCGHGLAGPWAYAVGPEIYFVSRDGVYATTGGAEKLLSEDLDPLFKRGQTPRDVLPSTTLGGYGEGGYGLGGYGTLSNTQITAPPPIDWTKEGHLRLEVHENEVWFSYLDVTGRIEVLIYSLLDQEWRWDLYGKPPRVIVSERYAAGQSRLLMGSTNGVVYTRGGTSDDGDAIDGLVRTGVRVQGAARADKFYGGLAVEADTQGVPVSLRSYLGPEQAFHAATTLVPPGTGQTLGVAEVEAGRGRQQTRHPHFVGGLHARGLAIEATWITAQAPPILYGALVEYFIDPDRIETRPTDWSDCGIAGLKRIKGLVLEIDTGGIPVEYLVEADGQVQTSLVVTTATRQQVERTCAVEARLVRLRPVGAVPHLRYGVEWLVEPLPLALTRWESRPLDLGEFGWFVHVDAYLTLRSTAPATLTLTLDGVEAIYDVASTEGLDRKVYLPFRPVKTRLVQYRLDSDQPVLLYHAETFFRIAPWAGERLVEVHPFGGQPAISPAREGPGGIALMGV